MFLLLNHTIMLVLCVATTITAGMMEPFELPYCRLAKLRQHPRDCSEVMKGASWNKNQSGVYFIKPDGHMNPFEVYCDIDVKNVSWTVIQRRSGGFISFNRSWSDYKHGFGFLGSEFWLGLDKIGFLTNQKRYQLRVDLFTDSSVKYYLYYNFFRITDEWKNYTLGSDIHLFISTSDCPMDTVMCYNQLKEIRCSEIENCSCYLSMENITIPAGGVYLNSNCTERGYCLNGTIIWNYNFTCDSNAECQKQQYQGHRCHCKAGYHGDGDTCSQVTCCQDIYDTKIKVSDVYFIKPTNWSGPPFQVYCNMSDGGWTVFQKRFEGSVDFYRGWNDYKDGFGDLRGEHWLGNEKLHYITSQKDYELQVDMTDSGGDHHKAVFNLFRISNEEDMYRLNDGNEGSERSYALEHNRGNRFSTFDRDNDPSDTYNCASQHRSGWWFASDTSFDCPSCCHYFKDDHTSCTDSNLNGKYDGDESQNLFWYNLPKSKVCNLTRSEMKLRPVQ